VSDTSERLSSIDPLAQNVTMVIDPISPIAPARVRVVLLPLGRIKKQRFDSFVERLRVEHTVRLGDISPDALADKSEKQLKTMQSSRHS